MRTLLLILGWLFLFALEILRVYFIMPFPGSQHSDTVGIAYFLHNNMFWLRLIGLILFVPPLVYFFRRGRTGRKILLSVIVLLYGFVFYLFNFRFLADKMFYQPRQKTFAGSATDTTNNDRLVIGVYMGGEAKAYPIEVIGYHHQVKDTVGGHPILVTYCTVCRTGRVFRPYIDGRYAAFRLVGMDHFNAMLEDEETKSWWQQATGTAITGPLKGRKLAEIPSFQMRLGDWKTLHPGSLILQPDPHFTKQYADLKGYDEGTITGSLEKRDSGSWKPKSWVIGMTLYGWSKAYDWNKLVTNRIIHDKVNNVHVLLTLEPDNRTFYALDATDSLYFHYDSTRHLLTDELTRSTWKPEGVCLEGKLKGQKLEHLQAYQEFWHSWQTFHPLTSRDEE